MRGPLNTATTLKRSGLGRTVSLRPQAQMMIAQQEQLQPLPVLSRANMT